MIEKFDLDKVIKDKLKNSVNLNDMRDLSDIILKNLENKINEIIDYINEKDEKQIETKIYTPDELIQILSKYPETTQKDKLSDEITSHIEFGVHVRWKWKDAFKYLLPKILLLEESLREKEEIIKFMQSIIDEKNGKK